MVTGGPVGQRLGLERSGGSRVFKQFGLVLVAVQYIGHVPVVADVQLRGGGGAAGRAPRQRRVLRPGRPHQTVTLLRSAWPGTRNNLRRFCYREKSLWLEQGD